MTTGSYLISIYLRENWHTSPARINVRMCSCANGHGVSNIATGWCAWACANTQ
jgi:hypothetical protein